MLSITATAAAVMKTTLVSIVCKERLGDMGKKERGAIMGAIDFVFVTLIPF